MGWWQGWDQQSLPEKEQEGKKQQCQYFKEDYKIGRKKDNKNFKNSLAVALREAVEGGGTGQSVHSSSSDTYVFKLA